MIEEELKVFNERILNEKNISEVDISEAFDLGVRKTKEEFKKKIKNYRNKSHSKKRKQVLNNLLKELNNEEVKK